MFQAVPGIYKSVCNGRGGRKLSTQMDENCIRKNSQIKKKMFCTMQPVAIVVNLIIAISEIQVADYKDHQIEFKTTELI